MHFSIHNLHLRLAGHEYIEQHHAIASIALSGQLRSVFYHAGSPLRGDDLIRHGLSIRDTWDLAADHMVSAARYEHRIAIRSRPSEILTHHSTPGLYINTPGSEPAGWLAHPYSATIINQHFMRLFHSPVYFIAPDPHVLFVVPANESPTALSTWCADNYSTLPALTQPIYIHQGFPRHTPPLSSPATHKVNLYDFLSCS